MSELKYFELMLAISGLCVAWILCSGIAAYDICRGAIQQRDYHGKLYTPQCEYYDDYVARCSCVLKAGWVCETRMPFTYSLTGTHADVYYTANDGCMMVKLDTVAIPQNPACIRLIVFRPIDISVRRMDVVGQMDYLCDSCRINVTAGMVIFGRIDGYGFSITVRRNDNDDNYQRTTLTNGA